MRHKLDFDLLLADPELIQTTDELMDRDGAPIAMKVESGQMTSAIHLALRNELKQVEELKLQRRCKKAATRENCRFQLCHKVHYRDAHRLDAEAFTEDSTKPRVDAWWQKNMEVGEDRAFTARERALWQPVSEGTLLQQQQRSHALLYRRVGQTEEKEEPLTSTAVASASAATDDQPFGMDGEPPPVGPLQLWNAMCNLSMDKKNERANIRHLCRERHVHQHGQRPASASGTIGGKRHAERLSHRPEHRSSSHRFAVTS